ncbi:DUF5804 family protein [Halocalculus aciditolerans]|uniref:Uncharacterized protein n=1 Tax=Halocalculus aciditolerans TaxID=1383812 RepID=A0A830F4A8_9EURY|nr:DUF5804 family protein [Halocalculus aciditolerans]GGL53771.1 hypothetical protein GCM10009039_09920 [Halocalculus aciditolerans]
MTRVCLLGKEDVDLRIDIYSYETARRALATYDVSEPWTNTLQLRTNSLGNAVTLLNDLNWYLARLTRDAIIREPSVSTTEWLSRPLARQIRDGDLDPDEPVNRLKVYGVDDDRLVDPTFVLRGDAQEGTYERADYDESVVVRVTKGEFFA